MTAPRVITAEQRRELLRDVTIPAEDTTAAYRYLERHDALDLADMIGVTP